MRVLQFELFVYFSASDENILAKLRDSRLQELLRTIDGKESNTARVDREILLADAMSNNQHFFDFAANIVEVLKRP